MVSLLGLGVSGRLWLLAFGTWFGLNLLFGFAMTVVVVAGMIIVMTVMTMMVMMMMMLTTVVAMRSRF